MKTVIALIAALSFHTSAAAAGGLFIPGAGPQAQGRAGAFVAKADDPTALFHNPAGFAKLSGWVVQLGANFVNYDLTFSRTGVYEQPLGKTVSYAGQPFPTVSDKSKPKLGIGRYQLIPTIAASGGIGIPGVRLGFGIYAPQGYPMRDFTNGYDRSDPNAPPPPQRYDTMRQEAEIVMPSVAVAYRVNDALDIGARLTVGFGELRAQSYVWGLINYEEWIERDATMALEARDNFIPSAGLGVLYRVGSSLELGASWSSAIKFAGKGSLAKPTLGSDLAFGDLKETLEPETEYWRCAPNGTPDAIKACIYMTLPQTASIGGRWIFRGSRGEERGDIELDVRWEDWSAGSDIRAVVDAKSGIIGLPFNESVIRHGLRDVISVRLGGSYTTQLAGRAIGLRAGVAYDTAAAPLSWQRVDLDGAARTTFGAGFSYRVGAARVDLGAGYVYQPTRVVPSCNPDGMNEGCPAGSGWVRTQDRNQPDPAQPLAGPNNGTQNPINGGTYKSHYALFTLGITLFIE